MAEEPFILLSLKDDKAKELSQVISNDTSRKILDFLSKVEDATETDISEKINVPLSTIHYNMSHLVKANLIEVDEFHYSKKGKEVNHYKLANKLIIIMPKETSGIRDKLRKLLPIGVLLIASSFAVKYLRFGGLKSSPEAMLMAKDVAVNEVASRAVGFASPPPVEPNIALWFFLGGLFTLTAYFIVDIVLDKKK